MISKIAILMKDTLYTLSTFYHVGRNRKYFFNKPTRDYFYLNTTKPLLILRLFV